MKNLNKKIIKESIKNLKKIIIMIFWTESCTPCKITKNIIEELKILFKNKIKLIKININHNNYIVEKYSINSVPITLIIKNKIIIKKTFGIINKEETRKIIKKILK